MEKFREVLIKRLIIIVVINVLVIALILITGVSAMNAADGNEEVASFIKGFQFGIYLGLQGIAILIIIKYFKALKDETQRKKLYYAEQDERSKLIQDKIGGIGLNLSIGLIATATLITGFYNQLICMTLLCVLASCVLIKGALKIYFHQKF